MDRIPNAVISKHCDLKDNVMTKIDKEMLNWFGHVKWMSEENYGTNIYYGTNI